MRWQIGRSALLGLLFLVLDLPAGFAQDTGPSVTGVEEARLAAFDRMMLRFLHEHHIPGAALAVSKDGRLVYARGFGVADREAKTPVRPQSLFRIASLSKPITATAVLQLVERGKLGLNDHPFAMLRLAPHLEKGERVDPRLRKITVEQLLHHTAGFDRDRSGDPMFRSLRIARALGTPPPAKPMAIVRYMMGRRLDFDPGARECYSNFGYCVLGRVIEQVSGQPYEKYVRDHVLAPLHIHDMHIGHSLRDKRLPREVTYYEPGDKVRAVVGPIGKPVPVQYGGWYLEAMDAHGGWVASAIDLVRFADAFNHAKPAPLVKPGMMAQMFAPPQGPVGHTKEGDPKPRYYACGWAVVRVGEHHINAFHTGSLDGTSALLVRRADGINWAVLFNTRNGGGDNEPATLIDPLVHKAADRVKEWPRKDLYPKK
jgi:N-acyl-D-amino-acid deacylase